MLREKFQEVSKFQKSAEKRGRKAYCHADAAEASSALLSLLSFVLPEPEKQEHWVHCAFCVQCVHTAQPGF